VLSIFVNISTQATGCQDYLRKDLNCVYSSTHPIISMKADGTAQASDMQAGALLQIRFGEV